VPTWHVVLLFIIGTFGIFGNSLTLTVLFKRKRWTSVNVLIGIMSVSDLFVIPFVASVTLQSYLAQRFYTHEAMIYKYAALVSFDITERDRTNAKNIM
jgi:hypothetical protein